MERPTTSCVWLLPQCLPALCLPPVKAGKPSPWSHQSSRGVTHWNSVTLLPLQRGYSESFEALMAWFDYEAEQILLFNLAQPSVSQNNVQVVTEWASDLLGASSTQVLWSEEKPSDHSNCYLILWGFALRQGMFTELSLESFNNHHEI